MHIINRDDRERSQITELPQQRTIELISFRLCAAEPEEFTV
jgi:hypothetical protein